LQTRASKGGLLIIVHGLQTRASKDVVYLFGLDGF